MTNNGLQMPQTLYRVERLEEFPAEFVLVNQTTRTLSLVSKANTSENRPRKTIILLPGDYKRFTRSDLAELEYQSLVDDGSLASSPVEPDFILVNKTAHRIGIHLKQRSSPDNRADALLVIPAFGSRKFALSVLDEYDYQPWVQRGLIERTSVKQVDAPGASTFETAIGTAFIGYLFIGFFLAIGINGKPSEGDSPLRFDPSFWLYYLSGLILFIAVGSIILTIRSLKEGQFGRFMNVIFLVFSAITPLTLVVYFFGGASTLVTQPAITIGFLGRCFQFLLILLLSLLPGLLYYQFDRQQVVAIRERFLREIMMLDPNVVTLDDASIIYGNMVDEISGNVGATNRQYSLIGTGVPIMIATWLVTMGWVLTINPIGSFDIGERQLASYLNPNPSPLPFAFLGSYFFALNLIFRRYVRGDLAPKAYNHVIVRIFISIFIVWVVTVIPIITTLGPAYIAVIAFLVGIFPESGLALVQDAMRKLPLGVVFPSLEENHPITDLEGVNLYDRVRLLEEGVESVENLVHYNPIELLLRTGMPTARLVDLVDQAILYLHVRGGLVAGEPKLEALSKLREYGIRTATQLIQAYTANTNEDREVLLALLGPTNNIRPLRLHLVIQAIQGYQWVDYLLHWRLTSHAGQRTYRLDDFYSSAPARHLYADILDQQLGTAPATDPPLSA